MCYFSKQVNLKSTYNPKQEKLRTTMCHMLIQLWSMNNSKVDAKEMELTLNSEMLLLHCVGVFSIHESRGTNSIDFSQTSWHRCYATLPSSSTYSVPWHRSALPLLPQPSCPSAMLPTMQHLQGGGKCPRLRVTSVQAEGTPSLVGGIHALAKICYLNRRLCCVFRDTRK